MNANSPKTEVKKIWHEYREALKSTQRILSSRIGVREKILAIHLLSDPVYAAESDSRESVLKIMELDKKRRFDALHDLIALRDKTNASALQAS